MPYQQRYPRRRPVRRVAKRRPSQRAQFKKYGSRIGGMAHTAYKVAMRLKDMVNTEYKLHEQTQNTNYDYNGTLVSLLNGLSNGTLDTQRVGDSIKLQNLTLRMYFGRVTADSIIRVIVLQDPQNKLSSATDILQAAGSVFSVLSPKNYDKRFQSKILLDQVIALDTDTTLIKKDYVIPLNWHCQFQAGGTTINSGDLKMLIISNLVTSNLPTAAWYSRVTFTDN